MAEIRHLSFLCKILISIGRLCNLFLLFLSCQRDARRGCIFCHFELFEHFNCSKNFEVRKSENASVKKLLAEQWKLEMLRNLFGKVTILYFFVLKTNVWIALWDTRAFFKSQLIIQINFFEKWVGDQRNNVLTNTWESWKN